LRFYLPSAESCLVLEMQSASKAEAGNFTFAVNIGLWNAAVASTFGGPTSCSSIGAMECHWSLRAGQLGEKKRGLWFTLGDSMLEKNAILENLWTETFSILNLLLPLRNDAALLHYLRT
jgi:hypothetical protein